MGKGHIVELGCGPAHVAAYIASRGVDISGLDLSPQMVEQARRLFPTVKVVVGDMLALPFADGSLGGVIAFYSIIHFDDAQLATAFAEMARVLRHDGRLALAFHVGDEVLRREQWWEMPVVLDFRFLEADLITRLLGAAGFQIESSVVRPPYPDIEFQSQRCYIVATKLDMTGA